MGFLSFLGAEYRHIRRYNKILRVLARYGFEDLVAHLDESRIWRWIRRLLPKSFYARARSLSKWEKMRLVCEELGPTFVKFGQILSNRPDLLPPPLIAELEKLQDRVPPIPGREAREVIERQLGRSAAELFASLDEQAFASASIAQVHRARLHTGEEVVIKVQRPGIRETIDSDIRAIYYAAEVLMKRVPSVRSFDPPGLVRTFEESIRLELDFVHESINLQRFSDNFKGGKENESHTLAPAVYREYSTDRVLVMEFISGIKVNDVKRLDAEGLDRRIIAARLVDSYFHQVFYHGFFHADPHPGNILILPGNRICFLDFGMMGNVMEKDLEQLASMFLAVRAKDPRRIIRALQQLSDNPVIRNFRALEADLFEFVHNYAVREIHMNEISTMLLELKDIIVRHELKVPSHFFLLARSLVSVEGVCRQLDPTLDLTAMVRPHLLRVLRRKYKPGLFFKRILNSIYEMGMYMEDFPRDIKTAIRRINRGEMQVELKHQGVDPIIHSMVRTSRIMVAAVLAAALIVGSSLLMVAGTPPLRSGLSVPAMVGFALALLVAAGMINNLRKGDKDT
ncbi:MAG: ABC1 kinase family protein [Flavobacteriales bacterium]|jgi:ubiquinone biosynthesis protein